MKPWVEPETLGFEVTVSNHQRFPALRSAAYPISNLVFGNSLLVCGYQSEEYNLRNSALFWYTCLILLFIAVTIVTHCFSTSISQFYRGKMSSVQRAVTQTISRVSLRAACHHLRKPHAEAKEQHLFGAKRRSSCGQQPQQSQEGQVSPQSPPRGACLRV